MVKDGDWKDGRNNSRAAMVQKSAKFELRTGRAENEVEGNVETMTVCADVENGITLISLGIAFFVVLASVVVIAARFNE